MWQQTRDFLSSSFKSAAEHLSDAKDSVVIKGLEYSGILGGTMANMGVSLAKGAGAITAVAVPVTLLGGGSLGAAFAGAALGSAVLGVPLGMMLNLDNMLDGKSIGTKINNFFQSKRSDYIMNHAL